MFSRKEHLLMKTGPDGVGRYDFLRLLKKEFCETNSEDAKEQIIANLANFSYDPINYDFIRSLNIIGLLLKELKSLNSNINYFSSAAICNLSSDSLNCQHIIQQNGVELIDSLLSNSSEEVVVNAITTLIFLHLNISKEKSKTIITLPIIDRVRHIRDSASNICIRNIATVFLEQ